MESAIKTKHKRTKRLDPVIVGQKDLAGKVPFEPRPEVSEANPIAWITSIGPARSAGGGERKL